MSRQPLDPAEVDAGLADLPGWSGDSEEIRATFDFGNFREAVAFLVRLAFDAEEMNHHPEVRNVYGTVELRLTTHDAGGVTQLDLDLARRANSAATTVG